MGPSSSVFFEFEVLVVPEAFFKVVMAAFGFVSLLLFLVLLVVQILNCVVFSSKFPISFGVNFILMCNLSNVIMSINNLYYLFQVTLLSLNVILMCNLINVIISVNNLYYLVKFILFGAAASCEVPNSNLAVVLFSSLSAEPVVFLPFFPNSKLWLFRFFPLFLNCVGSASKFPITFCVCLTLLHNLSNVAMAVILVSKNNLCSLAKLMLLGVVQLPLVPNSKLFAVPFFLLPLVSNSNFLVTYIYTYLLY